MLWLVIKGAKPPGRASEIANRLGSRETSFRFIARGEQAGGGCKVDIRNENSVLSVWLKVEDRSVGTYHR